MPKPICPQVDFFDRASNPKNLTLLAPFFPSLFGLEVLVATGLLSKRLATRLPAPSKPSGRFRGFRGRSPGLCSCAEERGNRCQEASEVFSRDQRELCTATTGLWAQLQIWRSMAHLLLYGGDGKLEAQDHAS